MPVFLNVIHFEYAFTIVSFIFIYIIAVSGLDIEFGYSGQISLGHAAFFAIGAYGSAILHKYTHIPVILTMIIAAFLAAVIGAGLAYPASKLVFHFLSLATIAFGEIVYQLVAQFPYEITGNFTGFFTDSVSIFGYKLNTYSKFYYLGTDQCTCFSAYEKQSDKIQSWTGFYSNQGDSHAADGMGINVRNYKILAFAISVFLTAFAGGMYAHCVNFISRTHLCTSSLLCFLPCFYLAERLPLRPHFRCSICTYINEALRATEKTKVSVVNLRCFVLIVIVVLPGVFMGHIRTLQ